MGLIDINCPKCEKLGKASTMRFKEERPVDLNQDWDKIPEKWRTWPDWSEGKLHFRICPVCGNVEYIVLHPWVEY
jgi:hypothetical protein